MIQIIPTKHLAGVKLQGDYQDLNALYDALMRWLSYYNEYTDILSDFSYEYLLALNYDIRHAFQGTREILAVGNNLENYDLISASTTPDVTLTTEQKKAVRNLKKQFTRSNVYYSVDIAVPLIFHYLAEFQHIFAFGYSASDFRNTSGRYSPLAMGSDLAQIHLLAAAVWNYLSQLLGEEEASVLYDYETCRNYRMPNSPLFVDAILQYFLHTIGSLNTNAAKDLIIFAAYMMFNPTDTTRQTRDMRPSHNQFQRVKKSLREKLGAPLPTINRFGKQIQKEFGTQTAINNDDYYTFLDTYYGTVDWDAEW